MAATIKEANDESLCPPVEDSRRGGTVQRWLDCASESAEARARLSHAKAVRNEVGSPIERRRTDSDDLQNRKWGRSEQICNLGSYKHDRVRRFRQC